MALLRKTLKVIGLTVLTVFLALVLFTGFRIYHYSQIENNSAALMQVDAQWSQTAATRDFDKIVSYLAPDAMVYAPNMPVAIGKPAAKKIWTTLLADPSSNVSWTVINSRTDGDLGFTTGTYKASFKGANGTIVNDTGKYVCVWKKRRDGWKAVHDIWNSDLPEPK